MSAHQSGETPKCRQCHSQRVGNFNGELAVHFTGLAGLDKPIVWVFPKLLACLDCGLTELIIPERELEVLNDGIPVKQVAVLEGEE